MYHREIVTHHPFSDTNEEVNVVGISVAPLLEGATAFNQQQSLGVCGIN